MALEIFKRSFVIVVNLILIFAFAGWVLFGAMFAGFTVYAVHSKVKEKIEYLFGSGEQRG